MLLQHGGFLFTPSLSFTSTFFPLGFTLEQVLIIFVVFLGTLKVQTHLLWRLILAMLVRGNIQIILLLDNLQELTIISVWSTHSQRSLMFNVQSVAVPDH